MGKKVVIVGGVAGGASCAARLRRLDENAEIVIIERGEHISYANCGLPYYVGGVIRKRKPLILVTPKAMREKYNIDVRVGQEVVAIDRASKTVTIKNTVTGEVYAESYDALVLSSGSSPIRPPIAGVDSARVMTLWTVPDVDRIRDFIRENGAKRAVVVGGGFIGLEMAENLRHAGLDVIVAEALEQVMPPLDFEMAQIIHAHLEEKGVKLYLSDGVASFADRVDGVTVVLKSGRRIDADIVILAIGARPNGELAKAAGLDVNARGGIITDSAMRTSDPDIYAVGDVAEVTDFIDGSRTMIPLAGPANKQGRIAADNIAGLDAAYDGTQGTSAVKIFDLTAASTGHNEKTLINKGMVKGSDYETIIIKQNSHAAYYPGAVPMTIKLVFSKDGKRIFGAQIVGAGLVDKRIDAIAAVIRLGGSVFDLKNLEFAYAPPFSSAKDPVNMAGFVAENILAGRVEFAPWDIDITAGGIVALDVREAVEIEEYALPEYKHIPLWQLRKRMGELDKGGNIVIFCAIGVRAYNAARILMQNGFENVSVYPGGASFYKVVHYKECGAGSGACAPMANAGNPPVSG